MRNTAKITKRLITIMLTISMVLGVLPVFTAAKTLDEDCPSNSSPDGKHGWQTSNYNVAPTENSVGYEVYYCQYCHELRNVNIIPPTGCTYKLPTGLNTFSHPNINYGELRSCHISYCPKVVTTFQKTGYNYNLLDKTRVTVNEPTGYDHVILWAEPWEMPDDSALCDIIVESGKQNPGPFSVYLVNFGISTAVYKEVTYDEYNVAHNETETWPTKGLGSITINGDNISVYLINCNVGYSEGLTGNYMGKGEFAININGHNSHVYLGDETNKKDTGTVNTSVNITSGIPEGYTFCDYLYYHTNFEKVFNRFYREGDTQYEYYGDDKSVEELKSSVRLANLKIGSLNVGSGQNSVLNGVAGVELHKCTFDFGDTFEGFVLNDHTSLSISDMTLAAVDDYGDVTGITFTMNGRSDLSFSNSTVNSITSNGRNILRLNDTMLRGNILLDDKTVPVYNVGNGNQIELLAEGNVIMKMYLGGKNNIQTPNRGNSGQTPDIMVANSAALVIYDDPDIKGVGSITLESEGNDGGHYYCAAIGGTPSLDPKPHGTVKVMSGVINAWNYSGSAVIGGSNQVPSIAYKVATGGEGYDLTWNGRLENLVKIYQNTSVGYLYYDQSDDQFNPYAGGYWLRKDSETVYTPVRKVDSSWVPVHIDDVYELDPQGKPKIDEDRSTPGFSRDGGTFIMAGGVVNVTSAYGGAAIGGGRGGNGGTIQIAGGTVNAKAGQGAAAIGGGAVMWGSPVRTCIGFETRHDWLNTSPTTWTDGIYMDRYEYSPTMGGGSGHILITGACVVNASTGNTLYDENGYTYNNPLEIQYYDSNGDSFDPRIYDSNTGTYTWKDYYTYTDQEYCRSFEDGVLAGRLPGFVVGSSCNNANGYYENTTEVIKIGGLEGNPLLMLEQRSDKDTNLGYYINENEGRIIDALGRDPDPTDTYNDPTFTPSMISGATIILKLGQFDGSKQIVPKIAKNYAYRIRGQINLPASDYMFTPPEGTSITLLDGTVMDVGEGFMIVVQNQDQFIVQDGAVVQGKGVWPGKPVSSPSESPTTQQIKDLMSVKQQTANNEVAAAYTHLGIAQTSDGCIIIPGYSNEDIAEHCSSYSLTLLTVINAGHYGFKKHADVTTYEKWSIISPDSDTVVSLVPNGALSVSAGTYTTINNKFDVILTETNGTVTVQLKSPKLSTPDYVIYQNTGADDIVEFTFAPGTYSKELAFKIELTEDQVQQNKAVFSVPKFGGSEFSLNSFAPLKEKCAIRYGGILKFTTPVADFAGIDIRQLQIKYGDGLALDGIDGSGHVNVPYIAGFPVKGGGEITLNTFKGTRELSLSVNLETPIFEGAFQASFKEARGVILLDTLYAELAVEDGGIPLVPPTVIGYLQGGKLGISGLADTVAMDSFGAPPARLTIGAKGSVMDVISGWINLSVGLDGFDLTMEDLEIAGLDWIQELGLSAKWDAEEKEYKGKTYWGISSEMGMYMVISVTLPDAPIEDYYGENVKVPAFIDATGSIGFGSFAGYYKDGNTVYFIYRLTASGNLNASINIPKKIVGGFFPLHAVCLGSVDLGFYAAATASSNVSASSVAGLTPSSVVRQLASNAKIDFDAAIGAKLVIGAGKLKGNVRIVYVLGDKGIKIGGGWGSGDDLDLSSYVNSASTATLIDTVDPETGESVPTIVETGMRTVNTLDTFNGSYDEESGDPEDIQLIRTRAVNTFQAAVSEAAAGKEFLVIKLDDDTAVLDSSDITIKLNNATLGSNDIIPAVFDEYGTQTNADANFFVNPGVIYFAPAAVGIYEFTVSSDNVHISSVQVIKNVEFASLDGNSTVLNFDQGIANYKVSDPDTEKLYKVELVLGENQGDGDYLLAETDELSSATFTGSLDFTLTGNKAPSGTYYPSILLLEYMTATDNEGRTVSTWAIADKITFSAVTYTNTSIPAAPTGLTLEYTGNGSMTASWTPAANQDPAEYKVTIYQYDETEGVLLTDNTIQYTVSAEGDNDPATSIIMDLSSLETGKKYVAGVESVVSGQDGTYLIGYEAYSSPVTLPATQRPDITYSGNVVKGESNEHTVSIGAAGGSFRIYMQKELAVSVTSEPAGVSCAMADTYDIQYIVTIPAAPVDNAPVRIRMFIKDNDTNDYVLDYITVNYDTVAPPLVLDNLGVFSVHETDFGLQTYVTGHTESGASVYFYKQGNYSMEVATAATVGEDGSFTIKLQFEGEPTFCIQAMDAAGNTSAPLNVAFPENPVTVLFDKNQDDAECVTVDVEVESGSAIGQLPTAYAANKIFLGWYTDPTGGTLVSSKTAFSEDKTLYAHWADAITVTLNVNAGEESALCSLSEVKVRANRAIGELPEPVITSGNKLFVGWFTEPTGGSQVTPNTSFSKHTTIYAHWTTFATVVFDAGIGTCEEESLKIPTGEMIDLYPVPVAKGYNFEGWYYIDEDKKEIDVNTRTRYYEDTDLKARWSRNTDTTSMTVTQSGCSEGAGLPDPVISYPALPEGQSWIGEASVSYSGKGQTSYFSSAKPTDPGAYEVIVQRDTYETAYIGKANFTITASDVSGYSVEFDPNGGTGVMPIQEFTIGTAAALCNNRYTAPAGYEFAGWAETPNGSVVYADEASYNRLDAVNGATYTLYAVWTLKTYTVTFETGDGASAVASVSVQHGKTAEKPADPTWVGHTFICWKLEDTAYDWSAKVTGDITLIASWEDEVLPAFRSHNMVLTGAIEMNFYADLSMLTDEQKAAVTMDFEISGNRVATDTFDENDMNDSGYYRFTCPVNSAQMSEDITATLNYGEGKTVVNTFSVKAYTGYIVDHSAGFTPKTLDFVKSIADYGYYMTPFLEEYGSGVPAGTQNNIENYRELTDAEIEAAKTAVEALRLVKTDSEGILSNATYALLLGSETTIRLRFTAVDTDVDGITVKLGDTAVAQSRVEIVKDGISFTVKIKNINAALLADMYTVTVEDQEGNSASITVSALSYADTIFTSTTYRNNEVAKKAMASLYYFYQAAITYVNPNN